jgi:hypothetical protein
MCCLLVVVFVLVAGEPKTPVVQHHGCARIAPHRSTTARAINWNVLDIYALNNGSPKTNFRDVGKTFGTLHWATSQRCVVSLYTGAQFGGAESVHFLGLANFARLLSVQKCTGPTCPPSYLTSAEKTYSLFNGLIARDAGNQLCTNPYDAWGLGFNIAGTAHEQDMRIAMERRGNKIGVETFKPLRDDVLQAIQANSPYVVYLNPESEYPPMFDEQGISSLWLEENEPDSRPQLSDLPLDIEQHYDNAIAPSDEAPLFWPHQLYDIAVSMVRDTRHVIATVANQIQTEYQVQDYSYPGVCAIATHSPHRGPVTPKTLQHLWGIGHETAMRTIDTTTQYAMRHATQPLR